MYQRKVDVDMLNAVKSVLVSILSVRPSSEQILFYTYWVLSSGIGKGMLDPLSPNSDQRQTSPFNL